MVDYSTRASASPKPAGWVDQLRRLREPFTGPIHASSNVTFGADTSEFQPYYDSTYPHPWAGFRADTGYRVDGKAAGNWRVINGMASIAVASAYVVYIPGRNQEIMTRLLALFGSQCPAKLCFRVDVESGMGFAGPGNHSVEANQLAGMLASYAGSWTRVEAYANQPDYAACWPSVDPRLKKCLARYTSDAFPTGYYILQYYGALPYASPVGYPRTCPPFGGYVDMNAINRTITQITADYGVDDVGNVDSFDAAALAQLRDTVTQVVQAQLGAAAVNNPGTALNGGVSARMKLDRNAALRQLPTPPTVADITAALPTAQAVAAAVLAILPPASGGAAPSLDQITTAFETVLTSARFTTG